MGERQQIVEAHPPDAALDAGRRLEISACELRGDFVVGQVGGHTVELHGRPPFDALMVDSGLMLPIARLELRNASGDAQSRDHG